MALGDKSGKKQNYEAEYFSRAKSANYEENLALSYSFWKGMLKLTIKSMTRNYGGAIQYDEIIAGYLTPQKAATLLYGIENCTDEIVGVDTGSSETKTVIAVSKTEGAQALRIATVNPQGVIEKRGDYNFDKSAYFLSWSNTADFDSMAFNKTEETVADYNTFIRVLKEYINASTGAISYSVMDMGRFNDSRINTKVGLIMSKLGIETRQGGDPSNSYFNKGKQSEDVPHSEMTTMDDLEDMA